MTSALAIVARYPEFGTVKTRLALQIGTREATELYAAFLRDLNERFSRRRFELIWWCDRRVPEFAAFLGGASSVFPQCEGDLGERMAWAFRTLLDRDLEGPTFDRVVLIGSDIPHIPSTTVDSALALLDHSDIVLGPVDDGGYYLVAMARCHDVFTGVEMGGADVLARTLDRAADLGLSVGLLPRSWDVDRAEDLDRLAAAIARGEVELPRTAAVLAAIGRR